MSQDRLILITNPGSSSRKYALYLGKELLCNLHFEFEDGIIVYTLKKADGTEFTANPYGWMTKEEKIPGVEYELCSGNIVWSCILSETVIAPVLLTGVGLYEPVNYVEPNVAPKEK
jgi:hypothetical protein